MDKGKEVKKELVKLAGSYETDEDGFYKDTLAVIEQLQAEKKQLREEKKDIANYYEKQTKGMRASLRRWCIANNFKLNDEGPDILIDS